MKVDAPAIGMLGQDKPFICVSVKHLNKKGVNTMDHHKPIFVKKKSQNEIINCSD